MASSRQKSDSDTPKAGTPPDKGKGKRSSRAQSSTTLRSDLVLRGKAAPKPAAEAEPEDPLAAARAEMQRRAAERIAEMRKRGGLGQRARNLKGTLRSAVPVASEQRVRLPVAGGEPPAAEAPSSELRPKSSDEPARLAAESQESPPTKPSASDATGPAPGVVPGPPPPPPIPPPGAKAPGGPDDPLADLRAALKRVEQSSAPPPADKRPSPPPRSPVDSSPEVVAEAVESLDDDDLDEPTLDEDTVGVEDEPKIPTLTKKKVDLDDLGLSELTSSDEIELPEPTSSDEIELPEPTSSDEIELPESVDEPSSSTDEEAPTVPVEPKRGPASVFDRPSSTRELGDSPPATGVKRGPASVFERGSRDSEDDEPARDSSSLRRPSSAFDRSPSESGSASSSPRGPASVFDRPRRDADDDEEARDSSSLRRPSSAFDRSPSDWTPEPAGTAGSSKRGPASAFDRRNDEDDGSDPWSSSRRPPGSAFDSSARVTERAGSRREDRLARIQRSASRTQPLAAGGSTRALDHFNKAVAALLEQDLDTALRELDKALELDPGNSMYETNRERVKGQIARAKGGKR